MVVWEELGSPNRYTKARPIIPLMKQIFRALCKRNILPLLTIHRTKYSPSPSEYRNEGKLQKNRKMGTGWKK
jgi:hypothetical protein